MASQDGGLTDSLGAFQDELVDIDRKSIAQRAPHLVAENPRLDWHERRLFSLITRRPLHFAGVLVILDADPTASLAANGLGSGKHFQRPA